MVKIKSDDIKRRALDEGFSFVGIAKAEPVERWMQEKYLRWIKEGKTASMDYLARNLDKRFDPRLLVEGVKTIVCVALNYCPARRIPENEPQIADYALGQDYHDIVKHKLRRVANSLSPLTPNPSPSTPNPSPLTSNQNRVFSDSAPVLERYWAQRAGLGWIGRNDQLIIPGAGSRFFLGELFLCEEVDKYDEPCQNHCGECRKCLDACPTGAIGGELFDSERCLSYQLIENRGELSELCRKKMGNVFYGCDRCQNACPWNRFSCPTTVEEFLPKQELLEMTEEKWKILSEEDYQRLFKGSAVKRAKYLGLKRNLKAL